MHVQKHIANFQIRATTDIARVVTRAIYLSGKYLCMYASIGLQSTIIKPNGKQAPIRCGASTLKDFSLIPKGFFDEMKDFLRN